MITPGVGAGGVIKRVHQEFDDGYVIGVFDGCDYVPLVFEWNDIFDCPETSILTSGELYHSRLMRKDGGLVKREYNSRILYDWNDMEKVISGYSLAPDGELLANYRYELNSEENAAICDADGTVTEYTRLDRYFWRPDNITQNDTGQEDLFSATQVAHDTCDFEEGPCGDKWDNSTDCLIIDNGEI